MPYSFNRYRILPSLLLTLTRPSLFFFQESPAHHDVGIPFLPSGARHKLGFQPSGDEPSFSALRGLTDPPGALLFSTPLVKMCFLSQMQPIPSLRPRWIILPPMVSGHFSDIFGTLPTFQVPFFSQKHQVGPVSSLLFDLGRL